MQPGFDWKQEILGTEPGEPVSVKVLVGPKGRAEKLRRCKVC